MKTGNTEQSDGIEKLIRQILKINSGERLEIRRKSQSYDLWNKGIFGNKLRTWDDYSSIIESEYSGTVTLRVKTAGLGGIYAYKIPVAEIPEIMSDWSKEGIPLNQITFNETAPDEKIAIQGYLKKSFNFFDFDYNTEKLPMRDAMKDCLNAKGITAKILLQQHLNEASYEDLIALLDLFPEHVVEFSTYGINLGHLPHRNTIIWEVRNY